jgi:glycosylphosphatidylinositol deacylase
MVRTIPLWLGPCLVIPLTWAWYRIYAIDYSQGGQWGCEMSWMTPSYIPIETPYSPVSRYKLYLYREIGWDGDDARVSIRGVLSP